MSECWIGIDQSYSGFGLSILRAHGHTTTVTAFPPATFGTGVDRLNAIGQWLSGQLTRTRQSCYVAHVCMEGYAYGAAHGREEAGELGAVVKTVLRYSLDAPACYPTLVPPPTLKKFVSGTGRAPKDIVISSVKGLWGIDFAKEMNKTQADDAADAYVLARIAKALSTRGDEPRDVRMRETLTAHTEMKRSARAA